MASGLRKSLFQSTRPLRGGTRTVRAHVLRQTFQSTRPLRGGTCTVKSQRDEILISIHPPLAGRDHQHDAAVQRRLISIHPPLAGRDRAHSSAIVRASYFNPPAPCGAGPSRPLCSHPESLFQSTRPLRGGTAILHKKTVQNIAYCTKSAFTLAVLSGFLALMRPFFLPNVHKFRCEPSEESLLAPRSHAYTIRTPSG